MDRRTAWVLGIIFGGAFVCLLAFFGIVYFAMKGGSSPTSSSGPSGGERIGVVEIIGQIDDSKKTLKYLKELERDDKIKAVIIRIDSPGGAVGPSQEVYDAVFKLRQKKKVVASMGSLAASGGFYIACAAEKVVANPGTLTGSVGVIFQIPNVTRLMQWAGVEVNTITAGKMKDAGSMFRTMKPEERAYFESVLADVHEQFIAAVAEGRGMKVEDVRPYADGRVMSGRQAKALKFVDELGGMDRAVTLVSQMAGIKGEPQLQYHHEKKNFIEDLLDRDKDVDTKFIGAIKSMITESIGSGGLQYRLKTLGTD